MPCLPAAPQVLYMPHEGAAPWPLRPSLGQLLTVFHVLNTPSCCWLPTAGVVRMKEQDLDFDNDADVRVLLLVHDTKPPFLDGRFLFTKQKGALPGPFHGCCAPSSMHAHMLSQDLQRVHGACPPGSADVASP